MKKILIAATIILAFIMLPTLSTADIIKADEVRYHTVVKGDTLWDIADSYYDNPKDWPTLWIRNPYVKNPHLIFPGDIIKITKNGFGKVPEVEPPVVKPPVVKPPVVKPPVVKPPVVKPPVVKPTYEYKVPKERLEISESKLEIEEPQSGPPTLKTLLFLNSGIITKKKPKSVGMILTAADTMKTYLHPGDEVYLRLRKGVEYKEDDILTIYKVRDKVHHPKTKKYLGKYIDVIGSLKITSAEEPVSAVIIRSNKEVFVGSDLIAEFIPTDTVPIKDTDKNINGTIVFAGESKMLAAERQLMYLDRGSKDGLEVGTILEVYKDRDPVDDPYSNKKIELPQRSIANLLVIRVYKKTATVFILSSSEEVYIGDKFRTVPAMVLDF